MSSLPPALNFAEAEVEICNKWKAEDSFRQQNKLAEERGDDVSRIEDQITSVLLFGWMIFAMTKRMWIRNCCEMHWTNQCCHVWRRSFNSHPSISICISLFAPHRTKLL